MSNVVDFLEKLGENAELRYISGGKLEQALSEAQIDPALHAALLNAEPRELASLLGASANVCSMIRPADEPEEPADDEDDEEEEDEEDDEERISQH